MLEDKSTLIVDMLKYDRIDRVDAAVVLEYKKRKHSSTSGYKAHAGLI